ncbi:Uncharacterised protein [uncultured archaeon]|nr:Uncharacterised protein [uncultured archaeon]
MPKESTISLALASLDYLKKKKAPLFLTTSNRWKGSPNTPKSTVLAKAFQKKLPKSTLIDIPSLNIFPCEGNVSQDGGNDCGPKSSALKDKAKNPTGNHRCWASINNNSDELWKVSKALFASDCVIFFGSVRWGQMNSYYQKLIERLTWLENRHTTLGEENILAGIDAGIIAIGHNWNAGAVVETQKQVLKYFGFNIIPALSWGYQFTKPDDETNDSYKKAAKEFGEILKQVQKV